MTDHPAETASLLSDQLRAMGEAALRRGMNTASDISGELIEKQVDRIDFALAFQIDRLRVHLLAGRRVSNLAARLEAELAAVSSLESEFANDAGPNLVDRKGQIEWLLSELRTAT